MGGSTTGNLYPMSRSYVRIDGTTSGGGGRVNHDDDELQVEDEPLFSPRTLVTRNVCAMWPSIAHTRHCRRFLSPPHTRSDTRVPATRGDT